MPTLIGWPALLVAVEMGVTTPAPTLTAYTVFPSGVTAIANVPPLTLIGWPAVLVAVEIGVTMPVVRLAA